MFLTESGDFILTEDGNLLVTEDYAGPTDFPSITPDFLASSDLTVNADQTRTFETGRYSFTIDLLGNILAVSELGVTPTPGQLFPTSLVTSADVAVFSDGSRAVQAGHYTVRFTLDGKITSITR